jgi:hypothetical protein
MVEKGLQRPTGEPTNGLPHRPVDVPPSVVGFTPTAEAGQIARRLVDRLVGSLQQTPEYTRELTERFFYQGKIDRETGHIGFEKGDSTYRVLYEVPENSRGRRTERTDIIRHPAVVTAADDHVEHVILQTTLGTIQLNINTQIGEVRRRAVTEGYVSYKNTKSAKDPAENTDAAFQKAEEFVARFTS